MKFLILCICLVSVFGSFLPNKPLGVSVPSSQNLLDFIIGNLVAVKVTDTVPSGFPCVTAATNLQNATQEALALLREGHVLEAAELFENALNATRVSCGAAASEGQATFENFLAIIRDPNFVTQALGRIRSNFLTILEDFERGVSDLNNQSFFSAGMDFGSIAHIVLSGPDAQLVDFIVEEITKLGAVNWPFTNCAAGSPLQITSFSLSVTPAKGAAEGLVARGTANGAVSLKQVQIVTLLNGTPLNTQYDPNTKSYQQGDSFDYNFSVTIPGFAPSGAYSITMTFQQQDGSTAGCVHVGFNL